MAFEGLSEKLNATFKHLRGKGRLSEEDIKLAMREVRLHNRRATRHNRHY